MRFIPKAEGRPREIASLCRERNKVLDRDREQGDETNEMASHQLYSLWKEEEREREREKERGCIIAGKYRVKVLHLQNNISTGNVHVQ